MAGLQRHGDREQDLDEPLKQRLRSLIPVCR